MTEIEKRLRKNDWWTEAIQVINEYTAFNPITGEIFEIDEKDR
ncbi:hypothetical protein [Thermosipho sp. (in: thermotogales)]|jgi:hypothetical protein|nr:hypothetical protein [Thermosipho sp. (in: thermotogales)]MBZ4649209.1 hypothetical protein [Thermosipho sp. (in: thermotogales)]